MRPTFIIATASVAALLTLASPARAQANRTFVSGHGSDSNPCTLADPCRSFAQALTQTNAGGEITVLDSAGYGTLTINKSITITNPGGVEAGITTTAGETAITIVPSSSTVITLRGLTLEGGGVGQVGIGFASSAPGTLNIIDCVVKDFVGPGIAITPGASGPSQTQIKVLITNNFVLNNGLSGIEVIPTNGITVVEYVIEDTTVAGNGTSGNDAGILVNAGSGFVLGTISSVHAHHNNVGVSLIGSPFDGQVHVTNSVITDNLGGDLTNSSSTDTAYLFDGNKIGSLNNSGTTNSDGTNDIIALNGNALTPFTRR